MTIKALIRISDIKPNVRNSIHQHVVVSDHNLSSANRLTVNLSDFSGIYFKW